jgi:two-component system chemotaxis sensor kinase CheA
MTIRFKILLGYFIVICCLATSITIVSQRISSLQNEIETIASRDIEIHNLIAMIRHNTINMETGQRGFLITGDETYLDPYIRGKTDWETNYNLLYPYISDHPDSVRLLERIKANIVEWIDGSGEPTIAMKRNNDTAGIERSFINDRGKLGIDTLRTQFESLRQAEIQLTKDHLISLDKRNNALVTTLFALMIIAAVISFLVITFVSRSITGTIRQVIGSIKDMAYGGDLTTRITVRTKDEIKDLADATNELLDNVSSQNWIQRNVAEVATMNQAINDMTTLAESFLSKLSPILDAVYGVFYIRQRSGNEDRMVKIGAYSCSGNDQDAISFRLGEGLIGQAALEKRTFLLNSTEEHPVHIHSGFGQVVPHSLLIVPIEFAGKVSAVVEFASVTTFTSAHLKLLEQIERNFGVAINNVAGRMEVERLLSESQVMTEELQTQTEELQAQSEELQMQQEEMRMTTEHLEEQNLYAEQKTKELEKAKAELELYSEQLQQSSQYKSNFLANMSHELRTPLNSILILSQILSENENRTLSAEEEGYASVINSSGNDLLSLIDDILDLSKIEAGKMIMTLDEVNVTEIPEQLKQLFQPVADKKNLSFQIEVSDNIPHLLHTDGQRLQQVIKNILSNAFKFTDSGSVTLSMRGADPESIEKYLPEYSGQTVLEISVRDTGIGIPRNKQQLIFEAFQQVDGDTTRQYGGTGLGLSICNEFMRLLGGQIILESELRKGSIFTLFVPSRPDMNEEQTQQQLQQQESAATLIQQTEVPSYERTLEHKLAQQEQNEHEFDLFNGKKVLLVEDDSRNVFALVNALESKGFKVATASNGEQCMDMLEQSSDYDLILMDIMMPIMDGFEAMRAIRSNAQFAELPIIALTAKAMKSDRDKCLEAGASDYISKPLNMEQLYSLMRVWLTKQAVQ